MINNVERFELTSQTTYDEYMYMYAVRSGLPNLTDLLPPEYPAVRIWYRYDPKHFEAKFHNDCPEEGAWWFYTYTLYCVFRSCCLPCYY